MRLNWLPATIGMLTLAACNANFTVQVPKTPPLSKTSVSKAAPSRTPESPSPSPSTEATTAPSTAPASLAPASVAPSLAPSLAPAPVLNPFGVPTTVRLPMPASVISVGGGNLIGQAGGNYRIAQAGEQPPKPLLSTAIRENMGMYMSTTDMADMLLMAAGSGKLKPGVPLTLSRPGMTFTYLLEVKDDHAVFSVGKGNEAKGPNQMIGISYTSPKKGRMVLWNHDAALGISSFIASDFDLEQGVATADGYGITQGVHTQRRWEFATSNDASGKSFVIRSISAESDADAVNAFTAHFMKDGSAVGATALADAASGGKLAFMPNDGVWASHDQQKPYDLYLSADGKDVDTAAASEALKGMMPTLVDFIDPVPPIPTTDHDPKTDARFKFPE